MEYTGNERYICRVVKDILLVPVADKNPSLTEELREKFSKAGDRIKEIMDSFNSLPGVRIEIKEEYNSDDVFELCIPFDNNFLFLKENIHEAVINVGFTKSVICYYDDVEGNNSRCESETFIDWQFEYFDLEDGYYTAHIKIDKLFYAVQDLINRYLTNLDK